MRMKQMLKKFQKKDMLFLLLMSVILAFFSLYHIKELDQIIVLNDEFGYWSVAASLAGKDWGELISNTPYYNYGYSMFLVPLFYIGLPSYLTYKAAILFNVVMLILGYWISILCGKKIFPKMNKKTLIAICFLINCYSSVLIQTQVAWTETLLNFLFWLAVLSVLSLMENPKTWKALSFSFILGYMFITHQRTIGIVVSGVVILVIFCISKKISFKKMILALGILGGILLLHFYVKEELKEWLWSNASMGNLNDFSSKTSLFSSIFTKFGLKSIFYGLSGRIFYFLVSGGVLWYCGIVRIITNIFSAIRKNKILERIPYMELFVVLSFLSTVSIDLIGVSQGFGRADSVVYARYIENTLGPILLMGMGTIIEKKISFRQIISYFIILVITGFLTIHIFQLIGNHQFAYINCIGIAQFFKGKAERDAIIDAIMYAAILNGIIYILINSQWRKKGCFITGIIVLGYWLNMGNYVYMDTINSMQSQKMENNESIAELFEKLEVDEIYYVKDDRLDSYCNNPKYLQFWIPDIKIKVIEQTSKEEIPLNSIWICEKDSKSTEGWIRDVKILVESKEFYVCTQMDSQIISVLEKKGHSLEKSLDLSVADSETWDKNHEGFRSNGDAGKFIKNYKMDFSAGTYNVNFNIEMMKTSSKEIFGKCLITKFGGKEILKELVIDKQFFKKNNKQIQISCMDTEDIEINIEVEKDVILNINSITYEKINNHYLVGSDYKKDISALVDMIKSVYPKQVKYSSIHKSMDYDFSYLESLYPELSFEFIHDDELGRGSRDSYVILERRNEDIFKYLEKYDCLMVNGTYILLTEKENGIAQRWIDSGTGICSKEDFINVDILRLNGDGTMYSDNRISLNEGTYEILLNSADVTGNMEFYADGKYENIKFSPESKPISKFISIRGNNQPVSWGINSVDGRVPKITLRKIDNNYCIELPDKEKIIVNPGEAVEIPLLNGLDMGTFEFIFTMNSKEQQTPKIQIDLYRKIDPINEFLMDTANNSEKNVDEKSIWIIQRYHVDRNGYQAVKGIIRNKGEEPIVLKSIQFKTVD